MSILDGSTPSSRLIRLRQTLGMSQRELAKELDVTAGAINFWEQGARPIPGPVLKLIELYEHHLEDPQSSRAQGEFIRKLSASWAERTFSIIRNFIKGSEAETKKRLQTAFSAFMQGELSTDAVKRKIQIALLNRAIESLGEMKGLPLKAAQLVAYMTPATTPEIREVFASLQYMRKPMAPTVIARVIFEELGQHPNKLFAEWSPKPFATASVGQVHLARLKSGERVAVKVQYPGIRKSLESDLRGISLLHDLAALVKPGNREILDHIQQVVLDECDYEKELQTLERFRQLFIDDPEIVVPKAYPDYSRKRVLTMGFIDGKTLPEFIASATQEKKNRAAKTIWRFTAISQLVNGWMNADAHPGNFLFLEDQVAFLDFGRFYDLGPGLAENYRRLCYAFAVDDRKAATDALATLPFVSDMKAFRFDEFWALMQVQQRHCRSGVSLRFTHEYIAQGMKASQRFPKDGFKMTGDSLWCGCSGTGLWSIFADLEAEANWGDLMLEIIEPGISASLQSCQSIGRSVPKGEPPAATL